MDTTIKREATILNEDIVERHGLSELQPDGKITTADLAGTGRASATALDHPAAAAEFAEVSSIDGNVRRNETQNGAKLPTMISVAGHGGTAAAPAMQHDTGPLFSGNEANELRARWDAIQVGFVDEPRGAVEQADHLVAGTMQRLAEVFAAERSKLEGQWDQGENVSTEDLRLALRKYRSFFGRLLAI